MISSCHLENEVAKLRPDWRTLRDVPRRPLEDLVYERLVGLLLPVRERAQTRQQRGREPDRDELLRLRGSRPTHASSPP